MIMRQGEVLVVVLDVCKVLRVTAAADGRNWLNGRFAARFAGFGFFLENGVRDFGGILSGDRIAV